MEMAEVIREVLVAYPEFFTKSLSSKSAKVESGEAASFPTLVLLISVLNFSLKFSGESMFSTF